jgi:hypothetical protein
MLNPDSLVVQEDKVGLFLVTYLTPRLQFRFMEGFKRVLYAVKKTTEVYIKKVVSDFEQAIRGMGNNN